VSSFGIAPSIRNSVCPQWQLPVIVMVLSCVEGEGALTRR
jgi:hypothetical protein